MKWVCAVGSEPDDLFQIGDWWYLVYSSYNDRTGTSATYSVGFREGGDDLANWQWGGTLVVHEVYQRADGTLGVKAPDAVAHAFAQKDNLISTPTTPRCRLALAQLPAGGQEY